VFSVEFIIKVRWVLFEEIVVKIEMVQDTEQREDAISRYDPSKHHD
jgi:hypothetical protein